MKTAREHGLVALDELNGPVERKIVPDLVADVQLLFFGRGAHGELVDEPVAEMPHIAAPASVHQDVVFIAGEPRVEPVDEAIEGRSRYELAILRAEDAHPGLAARHDVGQIPGEQRLKDAVA